MAVIELVESRNASVGQEAPAAELIYIVSGNDDPQVVRDMVDATIPAIHVLNHKAPDDPASGSLPIRTFFQNYDMHPMGAGLWEVRVRYGTLRRKTINFTTGGGQIHVTNTPVQQPRFANYAIDEQGVQVAGPDYNGAINVDDERVAGLDIGHKVYEWSETHLFRSELINANYRKDVKELTFTMNDAPFREFLTGEVLFKGLTGIKSFGDDYTELTFSFAQSDGRTAPFYVGTSMPIQVSNDKRGWDYLWIRYREASSNGRAIKVPGSVHVIQVYEDGDFSDLKIGVQPLD